MVFKAISSVRDKMSKPLGGFHRRHGASIRLSEDNTVAHRTTGFKDGIVFTEYPIAVGQNIFQLKLLEKRGHWAGSIVSEHRREIWMLISSLPFLYIIEDWINLTVS